LQSPKKPLRIDEHTNPPPKAEDIRRQRKIKIKT
jgi:hypothetical protein